MKFGRVALGVVAFLSFILLAAYQGYVYTTPANEPAAELARNLTRQRRRTYLRDHRRPEQPDGPLFDMMTVMRTPTCVNYQTIMGALKHLKPQGLRRIYVSVPGEWVESMSSLHEDVIGVDDSKAVPGVSYDIIGKELNKQGYNGQQMTSGRRSTGWYLMQFLNLGFGMRDDVLDFVLLHDADMMILSNFQVFGLSTFTGLDGILPTINLRPGGGDAHQYEKAHRCLLNGENIEDPPDGSSYTSHSWMSYRPYITELLSRFGGHIRDVAEGQPQPWLKRIVECIDQTNPHLGFGEITTYLSYNVRHHPLQYTFVPLMTWTRHPITLGDLGVKKNGFCCPTEKMLQRHEHEGYEYVGMELGHPWPFEKKLRCGYTTNASYLSEAYPPPDHLFWQSRNVRLQRRVR